ncbi:sulfatase family protein [Amycolatopsis thermoflava]|uniref:sulfatase family protein n=1 Tax=Amycolatopsis thermoflava TaxID=84480 RepID=UPI0003F642B5|nr:sulfatase [Amycolatopsis thermoflava]
MPDTPDNVVLVHWHDLGRHLPSYGAEGVVSPHTRRLAADSIVLTDAHATAPLCSPARGSILTGRYPHHNGLVGLAHHGWEYHDDVETLPAVLAAQGWHTALFGMQHESSDPGRLGYAEYDVSNSFCDHVVALAEDFLGRIGDRPFLLNAGFFETHRPYPEDRYTHPDPATVPVPDHLPDTPQVRADLAGFHGAIAKADAALGRLLDALDRHGLSGNTWVVFHTDHGAAFPRAKSTLYAAGTGIAFMIRPPRGRGIAPRRLDGLFSGVDLVPTLLELLGVEVPAAVQGVSHAGQVLGTETADARTEVFTEKTYHDSYDPIRAVRTKRFSYLENYAARPELVLPLDIAGSPSGAAVAGRYAGPRPAVELYDLVADPGETVNVAGRPEYAAVQAELAELLHQWRRDTGDHLPSDTEGSAVAEKNTAAYLARLEEGVA